MEVLTLDFETFYDNEYSVSKMTTEAYVRDSRFEPIICGLKWNTTPAFWLLPDRLTAYLQHEVDWANTALVCHHSHFDGLILSHHYGVRPGMHIDTLSMARQLDGANAGNSLHALCIRHAIGTKGDYVTYAKGKHLKDFTCNELHQYGAYCCNDCDRTYDLANIFMNQMPGDELRLIDTIVRMFTEPVFVGNQEKLRSAIITERQRKIDLLKRVGLVCPHCAGGGEVADMVSGLVACKVCEGTGVNRKPIGSNEQFAALLRAQGATPETKPSPTAGKPPIYAFAKTDPAMQELLEDEDDMIRFLAEARIGVKSNIIQTRAQRFLGSAERGPMPVYITYAAAHTMRMGGGDSMNWQNLSNFNENRPEMSIIQESVEAPPGHKIVRVDSGQGEARITAWNAGQDDLITAFREGQDVYSAYASTLYGRPIDRKHVKEDYIPGQLGKVSILGMGFGMGYLKASSELLKGMLGAPPIQFTMADVEALHVDPSRFLNNPRKIAAVDAMPSRLELNDRLIHCAVTNTLVDRYRARYLKIKAYWAFMETVISAMITGEELVFGANGCMHAAKEKIWMPNGLSLNYPGIERSQNTGDASYWDGRKRTKIHGPLLTENTTQCLHRIIVSEQMLKIGKLLKVALMRHDDVVAVVPANAADMALKFMIKELSTTPDWATGLPLIGDGGIGNTLLEAK